MKINIRRISGETDSIEYHDRPESTISNLKDQVSAKLNLNRETLKVCFRGKNLDDALKFASAGLTEDCTLIVVGRPVSPAPLKRQREVTETSQAGASVPKIERSSENVENAQPPEEDAEKREKQANLVSMGFPEEASLEALKKFNYDVQKAVEYLLHETPSISGSDSEADIEEMPELSEEAEEKFNEIIGDALAFFQKIREIPKFEEARKHVLEKKISPRDFADSICKLHPEYKDFLEANWDLWVMVVEEGIPDADNIVFEHE